MVRLYIQHSSSIDVLPPETGCNSGEAIQAIEGGDSTIIILCGRTDLDLEKSSLQFADLSLTSKN